MNAATPLLTQNDTDGLDDVAGASRTTVESLLEAARGLLHKAEDVAEDTITVITDNPKKTCLVIVCGVAFIAPVVVLAPLLGAAGFGAAGPLAGSLAASWQASMGAVAAGSLFATLQSAAMGGAGAVILGTVVQVGMLSILGVAFRRQVGAVLVNASRTVLQAAQARVLQAQIRAMQAVQNARAIRQIRD